MDPDKCYNAFIEQYKYIMNTAFPLVKKRVKKLGGTMVYRGTKI